MSAGYYLRIIKSTIAGIDEVPDFDDLGELFIDGIKIIVVGIVYMIVPIIIFILVGFLVLLAGGSYLLMFQGRSLALLFRSSVY
jgi:hypothetical protein